MSEDRPRVGEQRPGGRATRVRAAVLRATSELLSEVGYGDLTVEEVAARAGVHKTTIYRRWPTKPGLIADAVRAHSERVVAIPDTGSLAGDLRALAMAVAANIGSEGGARRSRSIVVAAATSDELTGEIHSFFADRLAATAPIIEQAIERGEIPDDTDPNLVIESLVGPIWLRLLLTGEPLAPEFAERVAALVSAGATAGGR